MFVGLCGGLCLCVACMQGMEVSIQGPGVGVPGYLEMPNVPAGTVQSSARTTHSLLTPEPSFQPLNLIIFYNLVLWVILLLLNYFKLQKLFH